MGIEGINFGTGNDEAEALFSAICAGQYGGHDEGKLPITPDPEKPDYRERCGQWADVLRRVYDRLIVIHGHGPEVPHAER